MRRYLDGRTLDEVAIERIRGFEADALAMSPLGYWVALSGGKDSTVIRDLFLRSGCKGEMMHNLTTIDPPESIWFIKRNWPDVKIVRPAINMWRLIRKRKCPPRRTARFCCQELKENGGDGRMVLTGIRWEESSRRGKRNMREACYRSKTKQYLHPIIDWTAADVWEYIRSRELPYCSLYDEGQKRIGCVLCPMTRNVQEQIARWPRIAKAWEKAVKATFKEGDDRFRFRTAEEYWQWWLDRDHPNLSDSDPVLFEDDPSEGGE